ncbi:hypothetical protein OSTOST_25553, partial [Ostertagia ostertagi]
DFKEDDLVEISGRRINSPPLNLYARYKKHEDKHRGSTKGEVVHSCQMHSKLFNTVNSVHRAYETTKLYRELKMRGAIVDESFNLKLLPLEQLVEKGHGECGILALIRALLVVL